MSEWRITRRLNGGPAEDPKAIQESGGEWSDEFMEALLDSLYDSERDSDLPVGSVVMIERTA